MLITSGLPKNLKIDMFCLNKKILKNTYNVALQYLSNVVIQLISVFNLKLDIN